MQAVEKAYEITDAKISFVSLVDKAANLHPFLITKAENGKANFTASGRIVKMDNENHYVTGIVYEPMTEDSQGNYMTEEEIVKAAIWYAKNGDQVDLQHSFEPLDGATVVENWVAKSDFKLGDQEIRKGTWLMTVEISDEDVWKSIEKGEITGFSMGGIGNYSEEDVKLDGVKKQETAEKKGLLKQIAATLGIKIVEKGAMAELYEERSRGTLFWNALNTLEECLYHYDRISDRWVYETDETKVRDCLTEFSGIITDLLTNEKSITKELEGGRSEIQKAGKKLSSKNKETLNGIYDSLGTFLKGFDDPEEDETNDDKPKSDKGGKEVTKQEVSQIVEETIAKAMAMGSRTGQSATETSSAETAPTEITPETVQKMVDDAIEKALAPQQEHVTPEQVQEMITDAVAKAMDPVLKSQGLPSNLNSCGSVEKSEQHYLHGIL